MYGNKSNAAAAAAIRISRTGAALVGTRTDLSASVGTRLINSSALADGHVKRKSAPESTH